MAQKVNNRDFVVAWATSDNMEDVMKATGLKKEGVRYRVKKLRERGVLLKNLPLRSHKEEEVTELNKLINKMEKVNKDHRR